MFLGDSLQVCVKGKGEPWELNCEWMLDWGDRDDSWCDGKFWVAAVDEEGVRWEIKWWGNRNK